MVPTDSPVSPGNPFAVPGQWYRGNLHTHTTESDGAFAPEKVLEWHAANHYHFVAITDHDRITRVAGETLQATSLLALDGAELSLGRTRQGSPLHFVAAGLTAERLPDRFTSAAEAVEWVWEQGGFGFIAHPHWSGFSSDELASLVGLRAIEVSNTGCARENHKGNAISYWDDLLGRGQRVWGLATDDSHWRDLDYGGGWLMVKAPALTTPNILGALRGGQFYSTCGPAFEEVRLEKDRLQVRSTPAAAIYWIGAGRLGWSAHAPPGQTIRVAEFELKGKPRWLRVEICDAHGRWAWSNPILVA